MLKPTISRTLGRRHILLALATVAVLSTMPALVAPLAAQTAKAAPTKTASASKTNQDASTAAILKRYRKVRDDMQDMSWYMPQSAPRSSSQDAFYLYFGRGDDGRFTPLRLRVRYADEDWLFVQSAWGKADGTRFDVPNESGFLGWKRDNSGGRIWEWSDTALLSEKEVAAVRQVAAAKSVTIRFVGQKYYDDRKLSAAQLRDLKQALADYEKLTGKALP